MKLRAPVLFVALVGGTLVACGGAPPPPPSTPEAGPAKPTAAPTAGKDDSAKKAAALEKMTADESKSGKCEADHEAALNKLLADVEAAAKSKTDDDGKPANLQLVNKKVLALGSAARGVELSVTGKGTELHVMAFGVKEISMDVLAGTTAASTMRSPYKSGMTLSLDLPSGKVTELQSDSRQSTIKQGQPLQVKMTGQGCAGMIAFIKGS